MSPSDQILLLPVKITLMPCRFQPLHSTIAPFTQFTAHLTRLKGLVRKSPVLAQLLLHIYVSSARRITHTSSGLQAVPVETCREWGQLQTSQQPVGPPQFSVGTRHPADDALLEALFVT